MTSRRIFFSCCAMLIGATIGAGIFSLPYLFLSSGWELSLLVLGIVCFIIIFTHLFYWQTLQAIDGQEGLLGLLRRYTGSFFGHFGFVIILSGLLLTLVVFLILAPRFVLLLSPGLGLRASHFLFWAIASFLFLLNIRRFAILEMAGVVLVIASIVLITSGVSGTGIARIPFATTNTLFPFGAVLFAMAGWTAVEPMYAMRKKYPTQSFSPIPVFIVATLVIAVLYVLFVIGVSSSAVTITPDTISGLAGFSAVKTVFIGLFGLFAILTCYIPVGLEIRNGLSRDLHFPIWAGTLAVLIIPEFLILIGLNSFPKAIGLVGGVFLSLQYLCIMLVGFKVLQPTGIKKLLVYLVATVFVLVAVYEVYAFIR